MRLKKVVRLCIIIMAITSLIACQSNQNVNIDIRNFEDKLFFAIDSENLEMAKEAIEAGADLNQFHSQRLRERLWHNELESNPLLIAINRGCIPIVDYLLECGANVNYVNKAGRTVLSYCAEFREDLIPKIIKKGADINYIDKHGYTALDYALQNHKLRSFRKIETILNYHPIISKEMIQRIVNDMIKRPENSMNYKVMHMVFENYEMVSCEREITHAFLGECDLLMETVKNHNNNPAYDGILLTATAAFGTTDCLAYLYQHTTGNQQVSIDHLFRLATMFGNTTNMEYLLCLGADINSRDDSNCSALELAAFNNQTESLRLLINLGTNFTSSSDTLNQDALYYAILSKNSDTFEVLLQYLENFDVNYALGTAIEEHNNKALMDLLELGVDANCKYGVTSLLGKAVQENNIEAVKILQQQRADLNADVSFTPLVLSIQAGFSEMATYLVEHGAQVNVSESYQGAPENIPIIAAIRYGQLDIIKMLVEHGARLTDLNYYGKTMLEFAESCGSVNVFQYLKSSV